jgi:hypothetical protein
MSCKVVMAVMAVMVVVMVVCGGGDSGKFYSRDAAY